MRTSTGDQTGTGKEEGAHLVSKIAAVSIFHGVVNSMWSSGREVVASATAHIASILGGAASSFVGRPRVLTTRAYVYAVFVVYHDCSIRTSCAISLSKGLNPSAVESNRSSHGSSLPPIPTAVLFSAELCGNQPPRLPALRECALVLRLVVSSHEADAPGKSECDAIRWWMSHAPSQTAKKCMHQPPPLFGLPRVLRLRGGSRGGQTCRRLHPA